MTAPAPATEMARTEQLVRGIFVVFLFVAVAIIATLVTRPGDGFPVGTCLRGHWEDSANSEITVVPCSEPHDYVVAVVVDDWNACPPATVGHLQVTTGGLAPKDRYECLLAA